MTTSRDSVDDAFQDRRIFGTLGGRLMAIAAIMLLAWFTLSVERDEARRKLPFFTPGVHALEYEKERATLKETAAESDAFLIAVAVAIGGFVLVYQAAAFGFGWALAPLAEAPRATARSRGA